MRGRRTPDPAGEVAAFGSLANAFGGRAAGQAAENRRLRCLIVDRYFSIARRSPRSAASVPTPPTPAKSGFSKPADFAIRAVGRVA
ncbi:MAG: hypothetical protein GYA33_12740 [Thermogutta sp.]|nr:hypothetical protein [Thermogutta sp.]